MGKLFTKSIIGILFLGVLGVFIFQIYQQREVLSQVYQWIHSGRYIFEGINDDRMRQQLRLQSLNNHMPRFDKIFKASLSPESPGLEKSDIEICRNYYHLVLEDMPQMQEAHVFLGLCEYEAGNAPGAFFEFKQGLASGAGVFWASYDLGVLAMMNGNRDAAEVLFLQTAKLPLQEIMKSVYTSKLFQQYMQSNNITPQKLLDGLNEARDNAVQNLKFIEESRGAAQPFSTKYEMRLRIF